MTAFAGRSFDRVRDALGDRVSRHGDGELMARCPAHDDGTASLTVTASSDRTLMYCHAGCSMRSIVTALGLRVGDLFDTDLRRTPFGQRPRVGERFVVKKLSVDGSVEALYDYHDEHGVELYTKVRVWPKQFVMGCERSSGEWKLGTDKRPNVLFRLPQIRQAITNGERVFVVEGERDVLTLEELGFIATCNRDGAATDVQKPKWGKREAVQLHGAAEVVIVPDNDEPGAAHAHAVVRSLAALSPAPLVRVVTLPNLKHKGDVTDWVHAGGTREDLLALIEETAPSDGTAHHEATREREDDGEDAALPMDITEDGLAIEYTQRHADSLRFCGTLGGWQVYDGTRWQRDETRWPYSHARALVRDVAQRTALSAKQYTKLRSGTTVNAIVSLASSDRVHAITQEQFDADPWLLNTPGGAVDLRTGRLRPNQPADYCTKVAGVTPGGDAPRWRQFLREVTGGNADLEAYLHRLVGYWLTGATTEHALVFVYGTGGNGKSVFLNTVLGLVGGYGMQAPMSLFEEKPHDGHPTELAMLRGARLVVATETEEGRRWAESRIKVMTGGDPITARFMHRDFFTYVPQFKPVIAGNHRPRFRNPDEAIRRRLHLVPFTQQFAAPDRELAAKLRAEAGGILAWAIEGCLAWQRTGLQAPDVVRLATEDYLEQEDSVGAWLAECCETDANAWTASATLWESWTQWAQARGEFVGSTKRLSERLSSRGFVNAHDAARTRRGFRGLRLAVDFSALQSTSGRIGQASPIETSYARAHDAHTYAHAHAQAGRANGEPSSDPSGGPFRCGVCRDPNKLFGVDGVVCFDCRRAETQAAA